MKKSALILTALLFIAFPSFCVTIDGKFLDWSGIPVYHKCNPRLFSKDRAGLDMQDIKLAMDKKYLYIYIWGRSMTGVKADKGAGAKNTSIRISFNSAQSPLNRIRVASDPSKPSKIKISCPGTESKVLGSKLNRCWAYGKSGKGYAFEFKIPVYSTNKGIHVGSPGGPLIALSSSSSSKRSHLSDMLINSVDTKTHRLVDTATASIRRVQ